MKSKSPPLPPELQEYLAQQARAGGFADSSEYLRALIRQQRAGQDPREAASPASAAELVAGTSVATPAGTSVATPAGTQTGIPAGMPPAGTAPALDAGEYDRLRARLDRLRSNLPGDAPAPHADDRRQPDTPHGTDRSPPDTPRGADR